MEVKEQLKSRLKLEDPRFDLELTDKEYYYAVGLSVRILHKGNVPPAKANVINKYLDCKSIEVLKNLLVDAFRKRKIEIYGKNRKILSLVYGYIPKTFNEEDKDLILMGFLDTNI